MTSPRGSGRRPPKTEVPMELVTELRTSTEQTPLAAARLRRQLTVERAAKLTRLTPDEVSWLEEGRLYRFPSSDSAVVALLLYATALGIDRREARQLAGLPLLPRPRLEDRKSKTAFGVGVAVVAATVAAVLLLPGIMRGSAPEPTTAGPVLPPTWRISVDVLNGSGDMNYTRRVASRIGSMAYRIERVSRADRFDYPETAVYFHPGGERIAERLADYLQVAARPLPGTGDRNRLVVVVGPARL
jgi:Helix-turn-helix domain/LytR cell envelope-related transcriptional attenuator